jgi:hypothetical protein
MSNFSIRQIFEVGERAETGLNLMDTIAVVFNVDEVKAATLALDPELRRAHSEGRTRGVAQVMEGLHTAARGGSASAAAALMKANAIALEQEGKAQYEIDVAHRAQKPVDHSKAVKAGFEAQRKLHEERIECRNCRIGPNGADIYIGEIFYVTGN